MKRNSVKIVLVDDHPLLSGPLALRLDHEPEFQVVGSGTTAQHAVALCMEHSPDILLLDIDMPGMSCFEAARQIAKLRSSTKLLFVSAFWEDRFIQQALDARAHGYLTKTEEADTLVRAIKEVMAGGAYFSKEVQSRIVVDSKGARLKGVPCTRASTLTATERQVMGYLAQGMNVRMIAQHMNRAHKTVANHVDHIREKLEIHNMVDLVRFAIREGYGKA